MGIRYAAIMPDVRQHRGRHPDDDRLFAAAAWPRLRSAVADLSWLLGRDYAAPSALKLVGDRYQLEQRQRIAVARCACSDQSLASRNGRQVSTEALCGQALALDGFNVLMTVEAALAGGVLLAARDGCLRDMASVHGTYRQVAETEPAVELLAALLAAWGASHCRWYLDAPVSNSGRLAALLRSTAVRRGLSWEVTLVNDPDRVLIAETRLIASADSVVLDRCGRWINLAREALTQGAVPHQPIDLKE